MQIRGHLQSLRNLGQIAFLTVRDGRATIQMVAEDQALLTRLRQLQMETPCLFTGLIKAREQSKPKAKAKVEPKAEAKKAEAKAKAEAEAEAKAETEAEAEAKSETHYEGTLTAVVQPEPSQSQTPCEMILHELAVLTSSSEVCPLEIGKQSKIDSLAISTLLDYRPITLRNEKVRAIFKIEAQILHAFRNYLNLQGFTEIHSPKIVATGTEGGAQLFALDYFGKTAYLAQSPQFYKQMMVGVFERVYEVGPVYRAEEHDTTRHINEYISLDLEMGFIESEQDIIAMQIGLLKHILNHLKENSQAELALYGAVLPELCESATIPQIELAAALELLQELYGWHGKDLDNEGEKLLSEHYKKFHNSEFVYVTNYPHSIRPFYAMPAGELAETVGSKSFDLLFRGLEITTGGQRIHEYQALCQSISARGLAVDKFGDYLLCFKHGMPPHGGLAIGLERITKQLLGLPSVKQCALFPRDRNRISP